MQIIGFVHIVLAGEVTCPLATPCEMTCLHMHKRLCVTSGNVTFSKQIQNATATFTKRPKRFNDATDTFGKTLQQHSENAATRFENVSGRRIGKKRSRLSLLGSSGFVSGFCPCKKRKVNDRKNPHSENAAIRFGKRLSQIQIRKTHLKTYDHVCLAYWTLLPSFPNSACTKKKSFNMRKSPHSDKAAAKFGKRL